MWRTDDIQPINKANNEQCSESEKNRDLVGDLLLEAWWEINNVRTFITNFNLKKKISTERTYSVDFSPY